MFEIDLDAAELGGETEQAADAASEAADDAAGLSMLAGVYDGDTPASTRRRLRDGGLVHVISVSGLHVGLLAGTLLAAVRHAGIGERGGLLVAIPSLAGIVDADGRRIRFLGLHTHWPITPALAAARDEALQAAAQLASAVDLPLAAPAVTGIRSDPMPPPTVKGMVVASATRFTTSSIVARFSTVAVISSSASSSAPFSQ